MKTRAIIQARMSSKRLPGKSLMDLCGRSLIYRVVENIKSFNCIDEVIIATTYLKADDPLEEECKKLGVQIFRGHPLNVLSRFIKCSLDLEDRDLVLRFTADNPLYNLKITQELISKHKSKFVDYTYIEGLSHVAPEAIQASAFRYMEKIMATEYEQEHVTPFLRGNQDIIKTQRLPENFWDLNKELSKYLTIDTLEDYKRMVDLGNKYPIYKEDNIVVIYKWLNEHLSRKS